MTETIGQQLKKTRKSHHLTLEMVAEATRIRLAYLQALENDDFETLPSSVQARGFLRNYAQYLELDLEQLVEELRDMQPEGTSEPEVIFEGDDTRPVPQQEAPKPELDPDNLPEGTAQEPFWQSWLRRVKREVEEADSSSASMPEPQPAPVPEAEPALETEAGPNAVDEAPGVGGEGGKGPEPGTRFLEWFRARFPESQKDDLPFLEIEEEPEPQPKPEPDDQVDSEVPAEPGQSSQEIIQEIARQLQRRREMLSLTLEEIERHTRMRVEFMDALEKGNFDELPSPVQTRGMLANYASFLDLDVDALLLRFADALQARHRERHPVKPAGRRRQPNIPERVPRLRTFIAGDWIFGIGIALLLVGFSVWGISRVIALQSEQAEVLPEATGPSISEALIGTPGETVEAEVTLIPAEDTPIPQLGEGTVEIPTPAANVNVQVNIIALERSYLRVTVDGEVAFDGRTIPGNAYPFDAEQTVEVLAGNGAALRVVYNQRDMGLMGGFGQIARFIYTIDEVLIPTPEVPPTETQTPFLSPTPTITPTPTTTSSPTPTSPATPTEAVQ